MESILGIDIGGTSIVGGRIEGDIIIEQITVDTCAQEGGDKTLNILKELIRQLKTTDTRAIGIGVPSVVDREKGIVYNVQNIKNWDEVHLKSLLEAEFELPVHIDNDANCFAYGEKIYGKGKDFQNFVGITLGTGVGGGIIQDNHLLFDSNCGSGEFGEIPYLDSILEEYCGSRFFTRTAGRSGYEIALKAREGDRDSIAIYSQYGKHISMLVKVILLILDPQAIIFGGSISKSFDLFKDSMYENLKDFPYPKSVDKIQILTSDLHNIGILGAGALCV
ncbi:Sugar kinase of the NBD/HSP70 family [Proteiniphilum saccharofermentans]|uniref:Sugar kinase of the NBD/HSP70 family n=1 Tax=Proteiniphilum saccharofermentans TaxID=1642647 RepID=A0A1R3T3L4_9BACT|nr:ROK family protein [Proteiniphilum saccharofermentans]SCD19868.1 Sugar kinase of the NBD/HSP70 family [Proteiniphilum saccharofermentans]